jgi:hypothetical protein
MSRERVLGLSVLVLVVAACVLWYGVKNSSRDSTQKTKNLGSSAGPFHFTNITSEAGVQFTYFRGETGKYWITETTGGGVALVDIDADGWLDILVADGCRQPPDLTDREHTARLFRNQHDGTFVEVTVAAGVAHTGYGQGCFSLDYDNDGFDDLYLTNWGPNALYQNNGDGTFSLPQQPGEQATDLWSTGAVPGDFDRDGDLDLLVVNYLLFDYKNQPLCGDPRTGVASYCGPDSFAAPPSVMLSNRGDGTFDDVSRDAGITLPDGSARPAAKGLGAVAADFDDDGWLDIYVANDLEPNFLFLNRTQQSGRGMYFEESALIKGAATNVDGIAQDSMGVTCGDYDGDGRFDLLVTNFYLEGVTLYKNAGSAGFVEATRTVGLLGPTRAVLGWGTGLVDFDNDGWLDLFTANGHVQPNPDQGTTYAMPAQLFRNVSGTRFDEVTQSSGGYFQETWNGRGAAFGDIDNDGDADIVVVHHHQPIAILRNDSHISNHWIRLTLAGRRSDRCSLGARIRLSPSQDAIDSSPSESSEHAVHPMARPSVVRTVSAAGSYLSSNDYRVLVGLGHHETASMQIEWPSGDVQVMHEVRAGQDLVIHEP